MRKELDIENKNRYHFFVSRSRHNSPFLFIFLVLLKFFNRQTRIYHRWTVNRRCSFTIFQASFEWAVPMNICWKSRTHVSFFLCAELAIAKFRTHKSNEMNKRVLWTMQKLQRLYANSLARPSSPFLMYSVLTSSDGFCRCFDHLSLLVTCQRQTFISLCLQPLL